MRANIDPLLLPLLKLQDSADSDRLLADLIREHADPIIHRIIKNKLRVSLRQDLGTKDNQDALDLASNLSATVIAELRELQHNSSKRTIGSFPDYVAIKTYSACADYFREKNPHRSRLKNQLRRHLKQHARFDLWNGNDNRLYAGPYDWKPSLGEESKTINDIIDVSRTNEQNVPVSDVDQLLSEIFANAQQPVLFDRVVAIVAERLDVKDVPDESFEDAGLRNMSDGAPRIDLTIENRLYLERLWIEVCQLPLLQRTALLLNLREAHGGSVICFIPYLGIASRADIAEMVGLPIEHFESLWPELPLDDSMLAERMDLSRQQVINLRKTARERLARRMRKWEELGKTNQSSGKKSG